jgi:hypothetical protein
MTNAPQDALSAERDRPDSESWVLNCVADVIVDWFENRGDAAIYCDRTTAIAAARDVIARVGWKTPSSYASSSQRRR